MDTEAQRYSIGELAELGGVSRRTVRYYVQRGLLPEPLGLGRGDHYTDTHLERLRRIKALQEQGLSLEAVAQALDGAALSPPAPSQPRPAGSLWTRIELAPGVELHIAHTVAPLAPRAVAELVAAARRLMEGDAHGADDGR
jgi:DNA-binding transcriptional MerR regulator